MKNSRLLLSLGLIFFVFQNALIAEEFATFESFYVESSSIGWILIGIMAIGAVLLIPFTGGGSVAAAIGTMIGNAAGLTGIAATNYGLALIGFGSLATGGLGIAGGTAILTAALTFSTEIVIDYTLTTAMNTYNHSKFVEDSKNMLTLPIPQNEDGSSEYEKTVEFLRDHIDKEKPLHMEENQKSLKKAFGRFKIIADDEELIKDYVLRSYLYFTTNDYKNAKKSARDAIELARKQKVRRTLPAYIYAVSTLYEEKFDFDDVTKKYFRYALLAEPDNELIPLMFAIYLDRVLYRMNDDEDLSHKSIDTVRDIAFDIKDEDLKIQALVITLMRYIKRVKIEQQKILSLIEGENDTIKANLKTLQIVKKSLLEYRALLQSMQVILTDPLIEDSMQENEELKDVLVVNVKYKESTRYLEKIINELEAYQVQLALEKKKKSIVMVDETINSADNTVLWMILSGLLLLILLVFGKKLLFRSKNA